MIYIIALDKIVEINVFNSVKSFEILLLYEIFSLKIKNFSCFGERNLKLIELKLSVIFSLAINLTLNWIQDGSLGHYRRGFLG